MLTYKRYAKYESVFLLAYQLLNHIMALFQIVYQGNRVENFIYKEMAAIENNHWWFMARRKIVKSQLQHLNLPENAKILEVGCGTGGNLNMLAEFGEVSALEPDQFSREYIKQTKKIDAQYCYLPHELPSFKLQEFDLIIMTDVLEHIEEDAETLQCLKKYLKKDGIFLVTVPAYQFLWSHHDVDRQHKRRYVIGNLVKIFHNAEFAIVKKSYYNSLLFPLIATLRLFHSITRKKPEYDTIPNKLLNFIFYHIFAMERFLLKYFFLPFGVSILLVAMNK